MYPIVRGIIAVIFILTVYCATAFAEKKIVDAEGKYVMGDLDTKQNAKALALMEAKRISLEKAGTYIEGISEVRDFELTKDQINSLAAGIMSVEIVKEEWKMIGENMALTLSIRAMVDISDLKSRIASMQGSLDLQSNKEIKAQLESLKKELADLKAQQAAVKDKTAPQQEMKAKNENIIKKMTALDNLKAGHAASNVQNYKEAIEAYRRALEIDPKFAEAYADMSIAYLSTKEKTKAVEMVNTALKLDPKSPTGHHAMALIMYNNGEFDRALESSNRAIQFYPQSPRHFFLRGEIYMKLRNGESALNDYAQACSMNSFLACQRADTLKRRLAEKKSGEDLYRAFGSTDRPPKTAAENIKAGHDASQARNYKEAIDAFKRALEIDPKLDEAYAGLSMAYLRTREKGKAVEMANTALKLNPKRSTAHHATSLIMYDDGKYDKALESSNVAIQLYSKNPRFFSHRADIYMKLGNGKSALKDYERACSMNFSWGCQRAQVVKQQMTEVKK